MARPKMPDREQLVARLRSGDGPAWKVGALARLLGCHDDTVRADIRARRVRAYRIPCGSRFEWVISNVDACRYATVRGLAEFLSVASR